MKHVKLFEEFNDESKYELIKPLPQPTNTGKYFFINTDDHNELFTIINQLEKIWYKNTESNVAEEFVQSIHWNLDYDSILKRNSKDFTVHFISIEETSNWIEVKFKDHFRLKQEFRGHKLRKYNV